MQHDAANDLDRVRPQAQDPVRGFPDGGKGLRQQIVQGLALCQTVLEFLGLALQRFLAEGLVFVLQGQNLIYSRLDLFNFPLGTGAE